MLQINRYPSKSELVWFGLIMLACFAVLGGIVYWSFGILSVAVILWMAGCFLFVIFYGVPPSRIVLYRAWMRAIYPLGWCVSHALFGIVYFLVITPMGVAMRLIGHNPLSKKTNLSADSHWREREKAIPVRRYFRQF